MKNNQKIYENPIIYIITLIVSIGIIMLFSASSTIAFNKFDDFSFFLNKHVIRLTIGFLALFILYNINFKYFKKYSKELLILSWIIVISAYYFNNGTSTNRWLIIGGINIFTTSDFSKIALIIFTAKYIDSNKKNINDFQIMLKEYLPY